MSLHRLGYTRADHGEVSSQLFASYSKVKEIENLAQIIGEDDLSETDKKYLAFGKLFEDKFLSQDQEENRSIEESLNIGWEILKVLPLEELERLSKENIEKYMGSDKDE